jgi:hypothetical protein
MEKKIVVCPRITRDGEENRGLSPDNPKETAWKS